MVAHRARVYDLDHQGSCGGCACSHAFKCSPVRILQDAAHHAALLPVFTVRVDCGAKPAISAAIVLTVIESRNSLPNSHREVAWAAHELVAAAAAGCVPA